jgi:DnaJ C terminal domain
VLDSDQFIRDVEYGYSALTPSSLNKEFLAQILSVYRKMFADCFAQAPDPVAAYHQLLKAAIRGLTAFTKSLPDECLQITDQAIFYTTHPLTAFVSSYSPLTEPFRDPALRALDIFSITDNCPMFFTDEYKPARPDDDATEDEVRRYRAQRERYQRAEDKARNKAFEECPQNELAFATTPLWDYRHELLSAPTVLKPLTIPDERWFEGTWIVAAQGRGKTNLLRHMALNLPQDSCFIFMDAKGELIDSFAQLKAFQDRLVLLEPSSQYPLAINPLDIGTHSIELLEYIFSALLETKMTPNQSTLFRLALLLCTKIPNATLETFREIMQHGWQKYEKEMRTLKKRDQDFFEFEWDSKLYKERRPEVLSRLRTLMATPSLDDILSAPRTRVDMGRLMDAGKIVCINNNYELLGVQGSEFFGRLFIALVWAAARKRTQLPDNQKRPVYFFIDEAHFAIARDTNIAHILDQCRAQKIAMIFAHQRVDQIKDNDVKSALTNCAIKFANSTGDAPELAVRLGVDTKPEFIRGQKRGQFACYVLDSTDTAVSVSVPLVDMDRYPKMTKNEYLDVQVRSRSQFCQGTAYRSSPAHDPQSQTRDDTQRTRQREAPKDDTHEWSITISPKKAKTGGTHQIKILADPAGNKKLINVNIPPGTLDGSRFRLKGAGIFRRDGTRGDVVLTVRVPAMAQHSQVSLYGDISDPDEIG